MKTIIEKISLQRTQPFVEKLIPYLRNAKGTLLDYGCGLGHIGQQLAQRSGLNVTYCDIRRYPFTDPQIHIDVFDGENTNYEDGAFDYVLANFVLHHVPDPLKSLREIVRVSSDKVIVFEDRFLSKTEMYFEGIKDAIANLFLPHMTFQYKFESEWEKMFKKEGLSIVEKGYLTTRFIFKFRHIFWILEK